MRKELCGGEFEAIADPIEFEDSQRNLVIQSTLFPKDGSKHVRFVQQIIPEGQASFTAGLDISAESAKIHLNRMHDRVPWAIINMDFATTVLGGPIVFTRKKQILEGATFGQVSIMTDSGLLRFRGDDDALQFAVNKDQCRIEYTDEVIRTIFDKNGIALKLFKHTVGTPAWQLQINTNGLGTRAMSSSSIVDIPSVSRYRHFAEIQGKVVPRVDLAAFGLTIR